MISQEHHLNNERNAQVVEFNRGVDGSGKGSREKKRKEWRKIRSDRESQLKQEYQGKRYRNPLLYKLIKNYGRGLNRTLQHS